MLSATMASVLYRQATSFVIYYEQERSAGLHYFTSSPHGLVLRLSLTSLERRSFVDPLMLILIVLVVLLLGAVLLLLAMQYLQLRSSQQDVQTAVITEKLSQLEPVSQAVANIQHGLAELQAYTRARQDLERQTAQSIRRLEMVIAGTQTKGMAGENILETVFANLPQEWQVRNFRVGDKAVEFALRLPNNLLLPLDSKWPATHLLGQVPPAEDP